MNDNFWELMIDDDSMTREEFFLKVRDLYLTLLKHLYNDQRDIPSFSIHFCSEMRSIEEGIEQGYPIVTVSHRSGKLEYWNVKDLSEIPNFENSYTWYQENMFVIFDFKEDGSSPLSFITGEFCNELFRQIEAFGIKRLKIAHMFEPLISTGVVQFFYGFYRLDINLIQTLSALTYEGSYINCSLIVPRFDIKPEKRTRKSGLDVAFTDPIMFSVEHLRQIRKIVELSDKDISLVINSAGKIQGLTKDEPNPDECKVRIWDHLSWTISYGDKKISYYNARYHIHSKNKKVPMLKRSLGRITEGLTPEQLEKIETVIEAAAKQRHGTIIIIGSGFDISMESARLCDTKSASGISETDLYERSDLIRYLTSIDGAVLMNTDCICTCIGAILDGDLVTKGNPARGARFNSTVNYVRRRFMKKQYFTGIVISEDGTVDSVTEDHVYRIDLNR